MFLEIAVEPMDCFAEPLTIVYLRDVSETMNSINLKRKNIYGKSKLERVQMNTQTLSHEIRSPLSSIIMVIDFL